MLRLTRSRRFKEGQLSKHPVITIINDDASVLATTDSLPGFVTPVSAC
jgi:hypothetical protein